MPNGLQFQPAVFAGNGGFGVRELRDSNSGANNSEVWGYSRFSTNGTTASDAAIASGSAVVTTTGGKFKSWM